MAKGKKNPIWSFIKVILIITIVGGLVWAVWFGINNFQVFPADLNITNGTIIDQSTTIIEPDDTNVWDAIITFLLVIGIGAVLIYLLKKIFEFLTARKTLTYKSWKRCVKAAVENLPLRGYFWVNGKSIPVSDFKYNGADNKDFPMWALGFAAHNKSGIYSKYAFINCIVDAKTLEVIVPFDMSYHFEDFLDKLHDQRFGKWAVPNVPGKTEKEPTLLSAFTEQETKPSFSVNLSSEGQ